MLKKVKGFNSLVKDTRTNAVINTDEEALNNAKKAKQKILNMIQKEENIDKRIDHIERMLQMLLEGTKEQCTK